MAEEARRLGPETLLGLSSQYLSLRDFAAARKYALLTQQNYPTRPESSQIIAVADVLLAAEKRLPNNLLDWFAILQLQNQPDGDTRPAIRTQFKKLVILLNPSKNQFPFSQDAFRLVCDALRALSDPQNKTQCDNEIKNDSDKPQTHENCFEFEQNSGKIGTFWTVCPYCYCLYEYEGVYEECCLRCQNCNRAFHAVAVAAPPPGMVVEEKEQYYCGFGYFPLRYCLDGSLGDKKEGSGGGRGDDGFLGEKKGNNGEFKGDLENVIEISDDSESEEKEKDNYMKNDSVGIEEEMGKKWGEGVKGSVRIGEGGFVARRNERSEDRNNVKRVMRRKSVAWSTKKMMGTGMKMKNRRLVGMGMVGTNVESGKRAAGTGEESESESESDDGSSDDDLEFFIGEDDIYVGFKNAA